MSSLVSPRPGPPSGTDLAVFILAGTLLSWSAAAQTEFSRTAEARADATVEIENTAGSVTVSGWDRGEVEVSGVHDRGVEEVRISAEGSRIEIEVKLHRGGRSGGSAELEVRVPNGSRIVVETVSADIRVSEVSGRIEVESVSGTVDVTDRPRSVEAETVSGNITVEDAERISAESVNGTIRLRGGRDVEAGTVSGSVRLEGLEDVDDVEIESVSGRIEFEGSLASGADLSISSHNGSIELTLPASVSARFEVSSFSGRIDNELGPPARRERFSPARELEFTAGSGDARVHVETFTGSIELRKR